MTKHIYVIDIETTGIDENAEIVEIGGVRWDHPHPDYASNKMDKAQRDYADEETL